MVATVAYFSRYVLMYVSVFGKLICTYLPVKIIFTVANNPSLTCGIIVCTITVIVSLHSITYVTGFAKTLMLVTSIYTWITGNIVWSFGITVISNHYKITTLYTSKIGQNFHTNMEGLHRASHICMQCLVLIIMFICTYLNNMHNVQFCYFINYKICDPAWENWVYVCAHKIWLIFRLRKSIIFCLDVCTIRMWFSLLKQKNIENFIKLIDLE